MSDGKLPQSLINCLSSGPVLGIFSRAFAAHRHSADLHINEERNLASIAAMIGGNPSECVATAKGLLGPYNRTENLEWIRQFVSRHGTWPTYEMVNGVGAVRENTDMSLRERIESQWTNVP